MAKKTSGITYTELDGQATCVCPYCGKRERVNNLLFRSAKEIPISADTRLAQYCYELTAGKSVEEKVMELQRARPAMLYHWRSFQREEVELNKGIVQALHLPSGERCQTRACPWCHNILSQQIVNHSSVLIFGQNTILLNTLVMNARMKRGYASERKVVELSNGSTGFVIELAEDKTRFQRLRRAELCQAAQKCIFVCELEENGGEQNIDESAQTWLYDTLKGAFSNQRIEVPTLIALKTPRNGTMEMMQKRHQLIFSHLDAHFKTKQICLWQPSENLPDEWEQGIKWLLQINWTHNMEAGVDYAG